MSYNDFIFGRALGEGSFGSVWIVTRKEDMKTYALKKVKIAKLTKKEVEYALNEVRLLYSLSHPNIVAYHESFYDEPSRTLNIVMEFCDDGDLAGKLKKNIKNRLALDENTIWNWLLQILKGLRYLHGKQVMHRDLKTANIFLTKQGVIKIGDLNISKHLEKDKIARTQTGTPLYCPPEIWQDMPYDYRCDIWSAGCIAYELAQGYPPFKGTSMRQLSMNIINGRYIPISSRFSSDLSKIINLMLTVDYRKRPNIEQLINNEIILRRMKQVDQMNDEFKKTGKGLCMFMATIKMPKNIKDINRALPQKRYGKRQAEKEMLSNDGYETLKRTFFQKVKEEENKKENPKINKLDYIKEENTKNEVSAHPTNNDPINKGGEQPFFKRKPKEEREKNALKQEQNKLNYKYPVNPSPSRNNEPIQKPKEPSKNINNNPYFKAPVVVKPSSQPYKQNQQKNPPYSNRYNPQNNIHNQPSNRPNRPPSANHRQNNIRPPSGRPVINNYRPASGRAPNNRMDLHQYNKNEINKPKIYVNPKYDLNMIYGGDKEKERLEKEKKEKERLEKEKREKEQKDKFNMIRQQFVHNYRKDYAKNLKPNNNRKKAVIGKYNYVPNRNNGFNRPVPPSNNNAGARNVNKFAAPNNNKKVIIRKVGK